MKGTINVDQDELQLRAAEALLFVDDLTAVAQIAQRFAVKYGPLMATAESADVRDRVEIALHHYLTARPTRRRPWMLSPGEAEQTMAALSALA